MSADREQATSFGRVADSYDRVRPGPPAPALDWLVPAGCLVAVDLAAGTGLFTRALLGRVPRVIAVEPDPWMREVLARRSPGLDVRDGRGEAMPLPDASADAVFITASAAGREASLARCLAALLGRAGRPPGAAEPVVEMPMRSWCWRAERSPAAPGGQTVAGRLTSGSGNN